MPRGGDLVVSIRAEPRTFNSLTVADYTTEVLASLTQAKLIRINRVTDELEPWLAESWTRSKRRPALRCQAAPQRDLLRRHGADRERCRVFPRGGVRRSAAADTLEIDGKKLRAEATDPQTVVITFPDLFAPGLRMLERLPVLPATSSKRR